MATKAHQRAERLRSSVVNAVCWSEFSRLPGLLDQLASLKPTPQLLRLSGVGHLVCDRRLWGLAGTRCQTKSQVLAVQWKKIVAPAEKGGQKVTGAKGPVTVPFGGLRAKPFLDAVCSMQGALVAHVPDEADATVVHRCAVALVLNGFRAISHIEDLDIGDLACLKLAPAEVAYLKVAVESVNDRAKRKRLMRVESWVAASSAASPSSAVVVATELKDVKVAAVQAELGQHFEAWGVAGLGSNLGPVEAATRLGQAVQRGGPMLELLQAKANALRLECKASSLPQVAAALRSWHAFAVAVLGRPAASTLPPTCGDEVEMWVSIFKNAGTAQNYVGGVRWACVHFKLCTQWDTESLRLTLKGAKRLQLRTTGGPHHAKHVLTDESAGQAIRLATLVGLPVLAVVMAVSWECLLRIQSEAVLLQVGQASDAFDLPQWRHSGVWVADQVLHVRLRQRKNRPTGSLLRRPCTCRTDKKTCAVHLALPVLQGKQQGQRLWDGTGAGFIQQVRRLLAQMGVPGAMHFSGKAFRAGKATAMAASGSSIGSILTAGEWRSAAFLSYIDETEVDAACLLHKALEDSDDDAVAAAS